MGFSIGNAFKSIGKGLRKATGAVAPLAHAVPGIGPVVASIAGAIGQSVGDSPERNAQKRQDFEYARSLADQRAFQDDSVQRRVADARAAGIHPLAALGYNAPSFIPQQSYGSNQESEYGLSEMGQDIGRAVHAAQTARERKASLATQSVIDNLQLQRLGLENRSLEADIEFKRLRTVQLLRGQTPGFPDINAIRNVGVQELGQGNGPISSYTYFKGPDGKVFRSQSAEFGEASENDPMSMAAGMYHNWVLPLDAQIKNSDWFRTKHLYSKNWMAPIPARRPMKTVPRPYQVKNRVRGSRISSIHTQ